MKNMNLALIALCCLATSLLTVTANAKDEYGKIVGRFVFDGDLPEVEVIVKKGDPAAKDAAVCAVKTVNSEELVIDPETKGIQHIFIYMRKVKSKDIHPDLKKSKVPELVFDQVGCQFIPHSLFVRTDQKVLVKSGDNASHNFHSLGFKNENLNFVVTANDRVGVPVELKLGETVPMGIKCDIHSWMKANWLVLDHPYGAITKKDGSFEIDLVPEGKHDFRVWQEKKGYIDAGEKRGFEAKVKGGETFDLGTIKLKLSDFES